MIIGYKRLTCEVCTNKIDIVPEEMQRCERCRMRLQLLYDRIEDDIKYTIRKKKACVSKKTLSIGESIT